MVNGYTFKGSYTSILASLPSTEPALKGKNLLLLELITSFKTRPHFNPIVLRMAKTLWSFGHSECNRVKELPPPQKQKRIHATLFSSKHGCFF